jgi:hypothetical protein
VTKDDEIHTDWQLKSRRQVIYRGGRKDEIPNITISDPDFDERANRLLERKKEIVKPGVGSNF